MNCKVFFGSFFLSVLIAKPCLSGLYDAEYENAVLTSPHIKTLHEDGLARRFQEQQELQALLEHVQEQASAYEGDLKAQVKVNLEDDVRYFTTLVEEKLLNVRPGTNELKFQIKYSKMHIGAQLALELLESSFDDIISGALPQGYSIAAPNINTAGAEDHIYSSGRGLALKHLLTRTAMIPAATSLDDLCTALGFDKTTSPWIQSTPLPTDYASFELGESPYVQGSELYVIHNGYTFGGNRDFPAHPFPAHDCSTLVAHYAEHTECFTTWHQATQFQLHNDLVFSDAPEVVAQWAEEGPQYREHPEFVAMDKRMDPIKEFDPTRIEPGSVYAFRKFPSPSLYGAGGHTAFVLGFTGQDSDAQVITVGTARSLEASREEYSYGVEVFPAMSDIRESGTLQMYFNLKESDGE